MREREPSGFSNDFLDIVISRYTIETVKIFSLFLFLVEVSVMTLTKADLVQEVYKTHPALTKAQATDSVESFLRLSKVSLIDGQDLLLSGFGKFNVKDKKARRGRNPQTGDELTLDERRVVTFKPSGILRDKINK
jgi:integration host factor subunit alpha